MIRYKGKINMIQMIYSIEKKAKGMTSMGVRKSYAAAIWPHLKRRGNVTG